MKLNRIVVQVMSTVGRVSAAVFLYKLLVYCRLHSVQAISRLAKFDGDTIL